MSKESLVFVLGIVVFLTPHLGIPHEYMETIATIAGLLLIGIGYLLRRKAYFHSLERESGERHAELFVEHDAVKHGMAPDPRQVV